MHRLAITLFSGVLWAQTDGVSTGFSAAQPPLERVPAALAGIAPENTFAASAEAWRGHGGDGRAAHRERALHRWSLIVLAAANAADAASSWRLQECNPLLARPGGQFGVQSVMLKSAIVGASVLAQRVIVRRRPDWLKRMAWVNFATAGAIGAIAHHNAGLR